MPLRNKKLVFLLLVITYAFSVLTSAQNFERILNGIPFSDAEGPIPDVFSGGHNNLEHQFVDIDGDADFDIMWLDSDGTYGWYKNIGDRVNPDYILSFDTIPGLKFSDWFYFVDIDSDNDPDLFTGGNGAIIEFRRNIGSQFSPFFVLEADTLLDNTGKSIFSEFGSNPVFVDIDNDGDFDFLSGNSIGTVNYYENIGANTSSNFEFITNKWQNISIIGGILKSSLHGASSLDFEDIDNDGDKDLFWGDFFGKSVYFIQNFGTATNPLMDTTYTFSAFPQNKDSVYTSGFNMPRLVDIDSDGDLDFFVTVLFDPTAPQSLMFYINQGGPTVPDLQLHSKNFLRTLDTGIQSSPFFIDIDDDGDDDLFTGNAKSPNGTLHFYENTGTPDEPSFALIDSSYFGIEGELTITPSLSDLDNDGDFDLIIGEFSGRLSFYENVGDQFTPNFQFKEQLKDSSGNFISAGNIARPFLLDVDVDFDLDLILGGFNGKLILYRNYGTANTYSFKKDSSYFGNIDVGDNSAAFLIDYDNDGDYDLFTGSSENIYYYRNDGNNIQPIWTIITEQFLNQSFGGNVVPFLTDIDNDTDFDLFLVNVKGGLYYFKNNSITDVIYEKPDYPEQFSINAYPNPFNSLVTIVVNVTRYEKVTISIFNILGEKVKQLFNGVVTDGRIKLVWDGRDGGNQQQPSGIYFAIVKTPDNLKVIKVILLK
jgi:hypothetical protein